MTKFEKELDAIRNATNLLEVQKKVEASKKAHPGQGTQIDKAAEIARKKISSQSKTGETKKKKASVVPDRFAVQLSSLAQLYSNTKSVESVLRSMKKLIVEYSSPGNSPGLREDSIKDIDRPEAECIAKDVIEDASITPVQNSSDVMTDVSVPNDRLHEFYKNLRFCYGQVRNLGTASFDGGALSSGETIHPNSLTELKHCSHWTVLVDETGVFNSSINATDQKLGRVVGIFVPEGVSLPACTIHACEERSFSKIDNVVQRLLRSHCGVLGVSLDALSESQGKDDLWIYAIESLLELAIRLLPFRADEGLKLDVKIEQRKEFGESSDCSLLSKLIKSKIATSYPSFSKKFDIKCRFVTKTDELSGYPDVVAYLWGSERWKYLYEYTCWEGSCLIDGRKRNRLLEQASNLFISEGRLSPKDWELLISSPDYDVSNSIISSVLKKIGEEVKSAPIRWFEYLNYVCEVSSIKQNNPLVVCKELKWLKQYLPSTTNELSCKVFIGVCRIVQENFESLFRGDERGYQTLVNDSNRLAKEVDKATPIRKGWRKFFG